MNKRNMALGALLLLVGACYPTGNERHRIGEGEVSDLVVVLKPDLDRPSVRTFVEERVMRGDGTSVLPEEVHAFAKMEIDGRDAFVLNLVPTATESQTANIRQEFLGSEFVDHVFQAMSPEQVAESL